MNKSRRRPMIRLISYLCAVAAAFGILAGTNYERALRAERETENHYQHAFNELVTAMTEVDAALQKSVYATSPAMSASSVCLQALVSLSLILNDVWSKEKLVFPNKFLATLYIPGFANHNGLREKLTATGYYFAFSCFFVFATQSVPGRCEDVFGFLEYGSGSCISLVSKPLMLVLTDGTDDLFIEILNNKERTPSLCDRSRGNGTVSSRN